MDEKELTKSLIKVMPVRYKILIIFNKHFIFLIYRLGYVMCYKKFRKK